MMFFGQALIEKGTGFANGIDMKEMDGLGMNYRFAPSTTGKEFENKSVFVIEYNDFSIKRIN
jgi:ketosteroid isomerase-like protein